MEPIVTKAITSGAAALARSIFDTGSSGARLVDNPVRLGGVIKWRWRRRAVAAKDVRRLVRQLLLRASDEDPAIRSIDPEDGEQLISALVATLLAFDAITMDVAQASNLDPNRLAEMLKVATKGSSISLASETGALFESILKTCCVHIIEHFTSMPEFQPRTDVATASALGSLSDQFGNVSQGIDSILRHLFQEDGLHVWTERDHRNGLSYTTDSTVYSIGCGSSEVRLSSAGCRG